MGLLHYEISLIGNVTGKALLDTGGAVYVAQAGLAAKQTLYNKDGSAKTNPIQMTNGKIDFYVADTVASVDLYIQTPKGRALQAKSVQASGPNEYFVDTADPLQMLVIPFSIADTTTGTETDTGFDLPTNAIVQPLGGGVDVLTLESGKTIDVGILSSESGGDADGFYKGLSLTSAVTIKPEIVITSSVWASTTYGVLLSDFVAGTNSDDRGLFDRRQYVCNGTAKSISYTLASTVTVAAGFIKIPYVIPSI